MRYFINDISALNGYLNRLWNFGSVLCGQQMTREIERWSGWKNFNSATTLLVFPGNGANIVRGFMSAEWLLGWRTTSATAKRIWIPGESPQAIAGRIFPNKFVLGLKDIVVIDDVVSSGETARKLRQVNAPWIPATQWHIVCWVAQKAASLRGFSSHHATIEVGDSNHKAPINSISTLLKEVDIAENYARRNFPQPETFLALLDELR